jgi:sugar phosphate isomerase/epimerase
MSNAQSKSPTFSLSTNWNSARHASGEAMVDEILRLGFDAVELGYQLAESQGEDVLRRVRQGGLVVSSVHAFCPAPPHVAGGHPELYLAASLDEDDRVMAVLLAGKTLEFAQQAGARAVVLHAGRIRQGWWRRGPDSESLMRLASDSGIEDPRFQKQTARALRARERQAGKHLEALRRSLDRLVPRFEKAGVALCLENLPSWEAVPSEAEIARLVADYPASALAHWHDLGHGQVRQHLGWSTDHAAVAAKLLPITRGIHIHDVHGLADDHQLPGTGVIDFTRFAFYATAPVIRVFEPLPGTSATALAAALARLRQTWGGG